MLANKAPSPAPAMIVFHFFKQLNRKNIDMIMNEYNIATGCPEKIIKPVKMLNIGTETFFLLIMNNIHGMKEIVSKKFKYTILVKNDPVNTRVMLNVNAVNFELVKFFKRKNVPIPAKIKCKRTEML